jgi:nucleotide-binding universal stress UspA family protein
MVILCGVDGSAPAREAARAAAALAQRAGQALELVYVQDVFLMSAPDGAGAGMVPIASKELLESDRKLMQAELDALAAALAREFQVQVAIGFELGFPDRELARRALEKQASFVVVGALGRRKGSMWRLGTVADRLSQAAPVPVLVVREAQGFARWAHEDRPLRVVAALGAGASTELALTSVAELARLGPCELVEAHAYDPAREARRLGLAHPDSPETRRVIERTLARELGERFAGDGGKGAARFVALPAHGHVAEALTEFAEREHADLLVAGARGRGALLRRFTGSVSYALVGLSSGNVLVAHGLYLIPEVHSPRAPAPVRRVLVATDLSETGNRAVDIALGLLPEGGQLTLLHVLTEVPGLLVPDPVLKSPEERRMQRSLAEAELKKLLPTEGRAPEIEVEALESDDAARAILQAAERHGVDLLVLGRHGHGPLAAALMGSVARAVSQRSPRPVLLVPEVPAGA